MSVLLSLGDVCSTGRKDARFSGLRGRGSPSLFGEVRLDHALDLRSAGATLEAGDRLAVVDKDERRNLAHFEPLDPVTLLLGVDAPDTQPISLLASEMGEQALHAPSRP
jgi:hypothetical protein